MHVKFVLADDESLALDLYQKLLKRQFPEAVFYKATNGEQAYKLCQAEQPDVLIADWMMPELTGLELLQKVKANPDTKDIGVLMVTGRIGSQDLKKAMELGALDYLRKPVDVIEFNARTRLAVQLAIAQRANREARKELAQKNAFLEQINKVNPSILYLIDLQKEKLVYLNQPMKALLRLAHFRDLPSLEVLMGGLIHPDDLPNMLQLYKQLHAGAISETRSVTFRVKVGKRWRWFMTNERVFERATDGKPKILFGAAQDITSLKNTEQRLKYFKETLHQLNLINTREDIDFEQRMQNQLNFLTNWLQMDFGLIAKVDGEHYEYLYTSVPSDLPVEPVGHISRTSETYCSVAIHTDGVTAIPKWSTSAYKNLECFERFGLEAYIGMPIVIKDKPFGMISFYAHEPKRFDSYEKEMLILIARRLSSMISLNQQNKQLEHLNNQKDQILATVAHDLRSPVSHVVALSELLQGELPKLNDSQTELFTSLRSSAERATQLINELLEMSTIEAESKVVRLEPTDLNKLLQETLKRHEKIAQKEEIQLLLQLPKQKVFSELNAEHLARVLDNLMSNAFKFTPRQKSITLSLVHTDDKNIISIADQGIGIPDSLLPQLFNKFSSARREGLHGERSTGLGMSIVKELTEANNGEVEVSSQEREGTTFTLIFPAIPEPLAAER